ncbi:hypothetical protein NDN08_005016 [Rhodosorus marinus]|uniref:Calmodulin n=1 Tax=Rhodosorus marinus TaxID=101924 RepID=A0AAV8V3X2_9RHOD|nr:hypothetical protein NDN08_005016 [Rhodosorus marinus]
MFESVVVENLAWILRDYVSGLDAEKVKLAVWTGKLELHDLELREQALSILLESVGIDAPLHVAASAIEHLCFEIPWKQQDKPVLVKLSNIAVLAKPQRQQGRESFEKGRMRIKRARLHADDTLREINWRERNSTLTGSSDSQSTWKSRITSRLFHRITGNLQLEFRNIVIRYEDALTSSKEAFSLQLASKEVIIHPTDEHWKSLVGEDKENRPLCYSTIKLANFEVGVAPLREPFTVLGKSRAQIREEISSFHSSKFVRPLLGPVHARANVSRLNSKFLSSARIEELLLERPFAEVEVTIPRLDIALDQFQYQSLLRFVNEIISLTKKGRFAFRPSHGREWWELAFERLIPGFNKTVEDRRASTASEMRKWRLNMKMYISARMSLVTSRRSGNPVDAEVSELIENMERRLRIEDILLYRTICDERIESEEAIRKGSTSETTRPSSRRGFISMFSSSSSASQKLERSGDEGWNGSPRDRRGTENYGLREVHRLNIDSDSARDETSRQVVECNRNPQVEGQLDVRDEPNLLSSEIAPLDLIGMERHRINVLVVKGSLALFSVDDDSGRVPFLDTRIEDLRLGILLATLDNIQVEVFLGTAESWDIEKQSRVLTPRDVKNIKLEELRRQFHEKLLYPELDKSAEFARSSAVSSCIGAMRYVQHEDETSEGVVSRISLQSAVSGFEFVVDLSSNCLVMLTSFWKPPESIHDVIDAFGDVAARRLENLRRKLESVFLAKQEPLTVDMFFQSSRVLISGATKEDPTFALDLGTVDIVTLGQRRLERFDEVSVCYSSYRLKLREVQAVLYPSEIAEQGHTVLCPASFNFDLEVLQDFEVVNQIVPDEKLGNYHKLRTKGVLPSVSLRLEQEVYWHLLRLAAMWIKSPYRENHPTGGVEYSTLIGRQLARRGSLKPTRARRSVPEMQLELSLTDVNVRLTNRSSDLMRIHVAGLEASIEDTARELKCAGRLCSVEIIDELSSRPILVACVDEGESTEAITNVDYTNNYELREQVFNLSWKMLSSVVEREFVMEIARFFYENPSGADPFESVGTTALNAARTVKHQAKGVVNLSTALVQRRGVLTVRTSFDGLSVLLTSRDSGDLGLLDIGQCSTNVEMFNSGTIAARGKLDNLHVKNLSTKLEDHQAVVHYKRDHDAHDSLSFSVSDTNLEKVVLKGQFKYLRVVHTSKFWSQLRSYVRCIQHDLSEIGAGSPDFQIIEVFTDEIEASKKTIPNFEVNFDFHNVTVLLPRNSTNACEGVLIKLGWLWVRNHPASEGYHFAFGVEADDMAIYVLYPHPDHGLKRLSEIVSMDYSRPSLKNAKVFLKVDWWRQRYGERCDGVVQTIDDIDPHKRLPAFRARWTLPEQLDLQLCEAQYTQLYCVLSENFSEPTIDMKGGMDVQEEMKLNLETSNKIPEETPFIQSLFEIPNLQLTVSAGADLGDNLAVLRASFMDIGGSLAIWPDKFLTASIDGRFCSLEDRRRGVNKRKLVMTQGGTTRSTESLLKFDCRQPYLGKLTIEISASELSVVVVPEMVLQVLNLGPPFVPYLATSKPVMETPYAGLHVSFDLPDFEVILYAEQTEDDNRSVVLRGGLNVLSDSSSLSFDRKIRVSAKGLQLFVSNEMSDVQNRLLLLSVSCDSLLCRLAVEDANLIVAVGNRMVNSFSALGSRDLGQSSSASENRSVRVYMSVAGARILITSEDSEQYLPILEARMQGSTIRASLSSILYFHTELSIVLVQSDRELMVNVTPLTIKGSVRIFRALKTAVENIVQGKLEDLIMNDVDRPSVAAYCVRNRTGQDIDVLPSREGEAVTIESGEEYHVMISKSQLMVGESFGAELRGGIFRCVIQVEGFKPTLLSAAEEGLQIAKLVKDSPEALVQLHPLVWDVSMHNGIPVATARSLHRLENRLQVPLEIKSGVREESSTPHVIAPDQVWEVPLAMADVDFVMRPKFQAGGQYLWSDSFRMTQLLALSLAEDRSHTRLIKDSRGDHVGFEHSPRKAAAGGETHPPANLNAPASAQKTILTCRSKEPGEQIFNLVLNRIVRDSTDSSTFGFSRQMLDVRACPPLTIINRLPRPLRLQLQPSGRDCDSGIVAELAKHERVCFHSVDPDPVSIVLKVAFSNDILSADPSATSFPFGAEVTVQMKTDKKPSELPIYGCKAMESPVHMDVREEEYGRTLIAFAPYWTSNDSDIDLEVQTWSPESGPPDSRSGTTILPARSAASNDYNHFFAFKGPFISIRTVGGTRGRPQTINLASVHDVIDLEVQGYSLKLLMRIQGKHTSTNTVLLRIVNALWIENKSNRDFEWCDSSFMNIQGMVPRDHVSILKPGQLSMIHTTSPPSEACVFVRLTSPRGSSEWFWSHAVPVTLDDILPVKMYNPKTGRQRRDVTTIPSLVVRLMGEGEGSQGAAKMSFELSIEEVKSEQIFFGSGPVFVSVEVERSCKIVTFADEKETSSGEAEKGSESVPDFLPWDNFIGQGFSAFSRDDEGIRWGRKPESHAPVEMLASKAHPGAGDWHGGLEHFAQEDLSAKLVVVMPRIGISFVDLTPVEIMYARVIDLHLIVHLERPKGELDLDFNIGDLQIDNQLLDAKHYDILRASSSPAVVKVPTPQASTESEMRPENLDSTREEGLSAQVGSGIPRAKGGSTDELLNGGNDGRPAILRINLCCEFNLEKLTVKVINELRVVLQNVHLRIDEEIVLRLRQFLYAAMGINEPRSFEELVEDIQSDLLELYEEEVSEQKTRRIYFKNLEVHATQITLSISASPASLWTLTSSNRSQLFAVARNMIALVGNVEDAEFRFQPLQARHLFATLDGLQNMSSKFYFEQLQGQGFKLLTSSNLLSRPAAVIDLITSSAQGLFAETKRPKAAGEGRLQPSASDRATARGTTVSSPECSGGSEGGSAGSIIGTNGTRNVELTSPAQLVGSKINELLKGTPNEIRLELMCQASRRIATGRWMRPPRSFPGYRLSRYDLRRAFAQILFSSLGYQEHVISWLVLADSQPDEDGIWELWGVLRDTIREGVGTANVSVAAPGPDADVKDEDDDQDKKHVLALISTSRVVIVRLRKGLVWACPLDSIHELKKSEEEEDVLLIGVRPSRSSQKTFWPAIVCGSVASRELFLELLSSVKRMRNQWQDDVMLGPVNRDNRSPSVGGAPAFENRRLEEILYVAQNSPQRDASSHRSVQFVIANNLEEDLTLNGSELKSGIWRREPPLRIEANSAGFFESDGGRELTADVHGSVSYRATSTMAELRFTFVNLFLAPNSFFSKCSPSISIMSGDHSHTNDHVLKVFFVSADAAVDSPLRR